MAVRLLLAKIPKIPRIPRKSQDGNAKSRPLGRCGCRLSRSRARARGRRAPVYASVLYIRVPTRRSIVRVMGASRLRLLLSLLSMNGAAAASWAYHGVVFGAGEWSSVDAPLGSAAADASLRAAIASGASSIRLIPTWYTDGENSTTVYRNKNDSAVGPFATETDEHIGHTIDLARSLGAKVILGPLLDPNWALPGVLRAGYPGAECLLWRSGKPDPESPRPPHCHLSGELPKQGRGPIGSFFTEDQWDQWFASYVSMMLTNAALAEKHDAEVLIIAAELWTAMLHKTNADRWRKLISHVRTVYQGKLAVAANANVVVPWSDAVDILGFDMYNGLYEYGALPAPGPQPLDATTLASAWSGYITWLKNVSRTYEKPILATELGYQSRPRAYLSAAGAARFNSGDCSVYMKCYSMEDQRLAYAAFYRAFEEATATGSDDDWFAG